jgi:hypothetical protein
MRVGVQRHAPAALPPGKRPVTPCIGGWVSPRAGLNGCGISRLSPGFDPRTVYPVASRYTDYAILARSTSHTSYVFKNHLILSSHLRLVTGLVIQIYV